MLTEDYCDFETAKLLKEKGFDGYTHERYGLYVNGKFHRLTNDEGLLVDPDRDEVYTALTLQMAMKWLREVHDIFIKLEFDIDEDIQWHPSLALIKGNKYIHTNDLQWYDTYEQAVEVAIKYCLENLI